MLCLFLISAIMVKAVVVAPQVASLFVATLKANCGSKRWSYQLLSFGRASLGSASCGTMLLRSSGKIQGSAELADNGKDGKNTSGILGQWRLSREGVNRSSRRTATWAPRMKFPRCQKHGAFTAVWGWPLLITRGWWRPVAYWKWTRRCGLRAEVKVCWKHVI